MSQSESYPKVSIIIPTRNEAEFIEDDIQSILASEYPADLIEILVVDGMSEDGTREIVSKIASEYSNVRLINNPRRITPVAFNLGIKASTGQVLFFIGGHASIARKFIRISVETFLSQPEAWCVGGVIETINNNYIGRVISNAMSSPVGVGNALFRLKNHKGYKGFVDDTIAFCCYWRWVFDKIGLFDEELVRNQDDEFNHRLMLAGGKIYLNSDIRSYYYARSSLLKFGKQYFQYGFWRTRTIQKCGKPANLRQIVPLVFVSTWMILIVASIFWKPAVFALIGLAGMYAIALLLGIISVGKVAGAKIATMAPLAIAIMHFAYGMGCLKGIWSWIILRGRFVRSDASHTMSR